MIRNWAMFGCLTLSAVAASNYTTPYTLVPFAGVSSIGSADGQGTAARFNMPVGIATDNTGNIYIADTGNQTVRKITPSGLVTTLAGTTGLRGGPNQPTATGLAACFSEPSGLAVDSSGNIFVTDFNGYGIRKITPGGVVSTFANESSAIDHPWGITQDPAGNLFYADWYRHTVGKITPAGVVTKIAGSDNTPGTLDGKGGSAQFNYPAGIAADSAGILYVSEWNSGTIRKITPDGTVSTLPASAGITDASATGLALDASGNLVVAAYHASVIAKISPSGSATIIAGGLNDHGYQDGPATTARFKGPRGVAVDSTGNLLVVESNNVVRKITPAGQVSTLAGLALSEGIGSRDGTGGDARFSENCHVAAAPNGDLVVADYDNRTVRKISSTGVVTTIAGAVGVSSYVDGPAITARFMGPWVVTVDAAGNILVFDQGRIRKITPDGTVSTVIMSVNFVTTYGLVADAGGNLFVSGDNSIKRITPSGDITDYAGLYLPSPYTHASFGNADGTGTSARFYAPAGIAMDQVGNIFVADSGNHTIRKITPDKVVTTFAGLAGSVGSDDGKGSDARFFNPQGLSIDDSGNLYVTEAYNGLIRKITPDGTVSTLAGLVHANGNAPGTGAEARLHWPQSITVDRSGNIYVPNFSMIYKGVRSAAPLIITQPLSQTVVSGADVQLSVTAGGMPAPTYQWYFNGSTFSGATGSTLSFSSARSSDAGDYTVVVTNSLGTVTSSKAALTVSAAPVAPATPSPTGGGGSIEAWFVLALFALGAAHRRAIIFRTR